MIGADLQHQSPITHHMSVYWTGNLGSERASVIYIEQQRQNQKAQASKSGQDLFIFFLSFLSFQPSPLNSKSLPSGLARRCLVFSPSEGHIFFYLSISLFFWGICHLMTAWRSQHLANFIVRMGSGPGQL